MIYMKETINIKTQKFTKKCFTLYPWRSDVVLVLASLWIFVMKYGDNIY